MRYLVGCVLVVVSLGLLVPSSCIAQTSLRVNESATRIQFRDDGVTVELPVENPSHKIIAAHVLLEILNPSGSVVAQAEQQASFPRSPTKLHFDLSRAFVLIAEAKQEDLLWYRLRYTITPDPSPFSLLAPATGILSVGQATPSIFELHVAGPSFVKESGHYTVRVRALHPVNAQPVAGVSVQASLDVDNVGDSSLTTKTVATDRRGFATLEFTLPNTIDTDEIDATVTGKLGSATADAQGTFRVNHFSNVALSTDKPLYQPGQALHMRVMAFDINKRAIADEPVTLKLLDPEETLVYRTELRTSTFGIASADWQIPGNLRLGTYRVQAQFGDGRYQDSSASTQVKISRYDLPSFTVVAKPDHPYYLPDQNASVEIRADYLFGEPVRRGHVRVVRETDRHWNYREQKWDTEEGEVYEGDTDAQGRYLAKVDLTKDHQLLDSEDYQRFRDLSLAAYFTDFSTGKTEQRRFDLRVTKDPIHVYVIQSEVSSGTGLPLEFYLSTDYADGSPAQCDVDITWMPDPSSKNPPAQAEQLLRRIRTNRYGVARVSALSLPDPDSQNLSLSFRVRDHKGDVGQHTESFSWSSNRGAIRVQTNKTLYKAGEPIDVQLTTSESETTLVVEASHDSQIIASKLLRVRHGHADLEFSPNEKFQNDITIVAYSFDRDSDDDFYSYRAVTGGAHTVLFPKDHDLKVDLKLAKSTYRPGEQASADIRVTDADGTKAKSALGLLVVDKAVEERVHTESDFGSNGGFFSFRQLWGSTDELNGVRRSDLDKIDLSKPVPDGLELVAEILLQGNAAWPEIFSSDQASRNLRSLFSAEIDPQIAPIEKALGRRYSLTGEYPKTESTFEQYLSAAGVHVQGIKDPWGTPYRSNFFVSRDSDVWELFSVGPDKILGTDDDFVVTTTRWSYFKPNYALIHQVLEDYHSRTGRYIRDEVTLKKELARCGSDFESWKDPWGSPYRLSFAVVRNQYTITVTSAGPDRRFSSPAAPSDDDFSLATFTMDYFAETDARLNIALSDYFQKTHKFPENLEQLRETLKESGINWDSLRDAWGHPYYATFRQESRYADSFSIQTYAQYQKSEHVTAVPVTQQVNWVYIRSAGEDGIEGTSDDFDATLFSRAVLEQSSQDKTPVAVKNQTALEGATGAISGTVVDPTGATVQGAEVTAKNYATGVSFSEKTNSQGVYVLRNLPAGFYSVSFSAPGFRVSTITNVPVRSSSVTALDGTLSVGSVSETVEVQAAPAAIQTATATVSSAAKPSGAPELTVQLSTPRLREYFPETLLWQPELITDVKGRAQLRFPLADNITTWRLSAVASTVTGEMGTVEKDIRAFQPFFVEHDPPKFLTVGDEIALPVVLRNYLQRQIYVNVQMKPSPWFSLATPATVRTEIAPRDSAQGIFRFRTISAIKQGKQEVTAIGPDASDAISRSVTVRPYGEEKTQTVSQVFGPATSLELAIPDSAISGSLESTLKIYPNLTAHVLESIEAIIERPYGCGEQTISSTYPSVLLLKYAKGEQDQSPIVLRAHRYAQQGYERLLSYRAPSGGFSYWGRGDGDLSLTVYAIKFLGDASQSVNVDDSVIQEALAYILRQLQPDGHWVARDWQGKEDSQRSVLLTAYIARTLVASRLATAGSQGSAQTPASIMTLVRGALRYLKPHVDSIDEPYIIASYALAAHGAGDDAAFAGSVSRLRRLAHTEADSTYWSLEMNTPFYGWGFTGRVETTALVLQALEASSPEKGDPLISQGLLFLIRNQDRYGIWYSTQATTNVLDAIASLAVRKDSGSQQPGSTTRTASAKAEISVDGKPALTLDLPAANALTGPIRVDISKFVAAGTHHVEIHRPADASRASAQLVTSYYVPWTQAAANTDLHHEANASDALRLSVHFDKQAAQVGDTIECSVTTERIGFRGYGMLLAEIGLPPGAEVDRASLETAMKASGWDISQYDVLPDRLIVYLWPRAGGTKFSFTFKPRFGMTAYSSPSTLYDYYNPEAHAVLAPTQFTVH